MNWVGVLAKYDELTFLKGVQFSKSLQIKIIWILLIVGREPKIYFYDNLKIEHFYAEKSIDGGKFINFPKNMFPENVDRQAVRIPNLSQYMEKKIGNEVDKTRYKLKVVFWSPFFYNVNFSKNA